MAIVSTVSSYYFAQPWWLLACILLVPVIWLARRSLAALGPVRRALAVILRCLVILILVALLARPMRMEKSEDLTLIAVVDRSQSIPLELQDASLDYLAKALGEKTGGDLLAVVDIAESANISKLPSDDVAIRQRNPALMGDQSKLAAGIQMAMAIAPPGTATRIVLVTEGNETEGDLKEAAQLAAANKIPIDVLPLRYQYDREVIFKRLAAPSKARSGQTVSLRFVLNSTTPASGKLLLNLNGKPVDIAPGSAEVAVPVDLQAGTNVKTVSVPLGSRGAHEFEAVFMPDNTSQDMVSQNNRASAVTYVAGPGHVLLVDSDGSAGMALMRALENSDIDVQYMPAAEFPEDLVRLIDTDAIILVNSDISDFTYHQQEMLCRYVTDLGGGLVMVGGPQSFGAGGWIGSPVAEILPVDLDPPQKKELPKGALVMIMHACEMPQGNYWGVEVAAAAVKTLSRLDMVGILAYNWQGGSDWVIPFGQVGDKKAILSVINTMQMGDMPSLHDHLQQAYDKLKGCEAAQKHVIVISDGDPQPPSRKLLRQCKNAGITVTGVAIFPHSSTDVQSLQWVAQSTGGRFYDVKDPQQLPQIFIKEAQVVRRTLIVEETFAPQLTYSLSEITRGLNFPLPNLDGYVLTGPKGGLSQIILTSHQADPVFATCQSGLGRCVAFTASADSQWASSWLRWGGFERFWEQTVRWAAKPGQSADVEVFADVQGRDVTVNVEAIDAERKFVQLAHIDGQVIGPDVSSEALELNQVGPGQYRGRFKAAGSGSYVINLRHRRLGEGATTQLSHSTVTIPFAPEFRDLSDNAPLLRAVSEITGGRVLGSDPNQADLFSDASVKFPETHLPLTRRLMLYWLAFFLLDVAVRRVALDVRAIGRSAVSFVRVLRPQRQVDKTIERLRLTRKKVREQLARGPGAKVASRRYKGGEQSTGELPVTRVATQPQKRSEEPAAATEGKRTAEDAAPSHIEQLLKAKRKAADRRDDGGQKDDK
ncbi:MAG: VWA domain-containing protein [Planctomycetota bacterium]|jgi:uncharacterized membrane protein